MGYKVLLTEDIDEKGKEYLKNYGYEIKLCTSIDENSLINDIADCDAVLVRMAKITENVIKAGKKLKAISKHGVGVDNIDIDAATKYGIQVTNALESNANTVAEFTIGLMISLAKNLAIYDKETRKGNYDIRMNYGVDLEGKVLGIIGIGKIGKLVGKKAVNGFGMKVIGYKRTIKSSEDYRSFKITDNLDYLLKNSDFVSLHVPLTESTEKMIGRRELSIMKHGAFLINTARGEVVDTEALAYALKNKVIRGAAVDVYDGEIPSYDNPLLKLDNVILTPHAAAHTAESIERMAVQAAMGIHEVLSGKKSTWPVNHIKK